MNTATIGMVVIGKDSTGEYFYLNKALRWVQFDTPEEALMTTNSRTPRLFERTIEEYMKTHHVTVLEERDEVLFLSVTVPGLLTLIQPTSSAA